MLPSDLELDEDPLRLRLDFHDESVIMHDYADGLTRTRLVSALDVAGHPAGTGPATPPVGDCRHGPA